MDTYMTLAAYGKNAKTAVSAAEDEIYRLDGLFTVQSSDSEIAKLNLDKSLSASEDTLKLIARACEISEITGGDFDITVAPLVRAWGFYSGLENKVPSDSELETALKSVGYKNIEISESSIYLNNAVSVDMGGIAKGYASSRAAEILAENGVESALISLGGNVRAVGSKPDGSAWTVAVADPDDTSLQIGYLSVKDTSVITSGGYQRFFEHNQKTYHHIINPKTGCPAESGLKSVTVVSEDDTLADALSTALFVKGLDGAAELYRSCGGFGAVFVTDENEIYITNNLEGSFASEREFKVISP
ncbi:MAG: FAD:protein FMN transferase [Oscillospiraceae bacterium]